MQLLIVNSRELTMASSSFIIIRVEGVTMAFPGGELKLAFTGGIFFSGLVINCGLTAGWIKRKECE